MTNSSFSKHNIYLVLAVSSMIGFCLSSQEAGYDQEQFFQMIRQNDVENVQRIITAFPDAVNSKDWGIKTPLHVAAHSGHGDVAMFLMQNGADVNAQDRDGWTPLHLAARYGHEDIVKLLLAGGADVSVVDQDTEGRTPLHVASLYGHQEVVKVLLAAGADANATEGTDPRQHGYKTYTGGHCVPLHWAALNGHQDIVKLLLEGDAVVNSQDTRGRTPLHCAAHNGHLAVVQLLLANDADISAGDRNCDWLEKGCIRYTGGPGGCTPLHAAAHSGHGDVAMFLIQNGADVNARNNLHATLLHMAAEGASLDVVRFLVLEKGVAIDVRDNDGATPLLSVAMKVTGDVRLEFIRNAAKVAKLLIEEGADVNAEIQGWTPLNCFAWIGKLDIVRYLVDHGAQVNRKCVVRETPLHCAATNGRLSTVKFLVSKDADVDALNDAGMTPLHSAAHYGHADVVEFLLKNGAEIDTENGEGKSALMIAMKENFVEVALALIKRYANVGDLEDRIRRIAPGLLEKRQNDLVEILNETQLPTDLVNLMMVFVLGEGERKRAHA